MSIRVINIFSYGSSSTKHLIVKERTNAIRKKPAPMQKEKTKLWQRQFHTITVHEPRALIRFTLGKEFIDVSCNFQWDIVSNPATCRWMWLLAGCVDVRINAVARWIPYGCFSVLFLVRVEYGRGAVPCAVSEAVSFCKNDPLENGEIRGNTISAASSVKLQINIWSTRLDNRRTVHGSGLGCDKKAPWCSLHSEAWALDPWKIYLVERLSAPIQSLET